MNTFLTVFFDFLQPVIFDALESFPVMDVKYNNDALSLFIVCAGDGSESLLSCSIPDLKFDESLIDLQCPVKLVNLYLNLKSTPIVAWYVYSKWSSAYLLSKLDLPADESPTKATL